MDMVCLIITDVTSDLDLKQDAELKPGTKYHDWKTFITVAFWGNSNSISETQHQDHHSTDDADRCFQDKVGREWSFNVNEHKRQFYGKYKII